MMNLSEDTEELEDFIRLDFADLQASENLQLLDTGIIDLECDSEDECTNVKEPESFHGQPDLPADLQSVTTSHSNKIDIKPVCIKVVDCYKFPWYFDQFKDIIEHKIAMNRSVEFDDGILDDSFTDPSKELVDNTHVVDISVLERHSNEEKINSTVFMADECRKEVAESNKDVKSANKLLENMKPITHAKSVRNNVKNNKMDFDIQRAMEERKNSVVDLKRNIGLVGMKILRLPNKMANISISKQLKTPMEANREIKQHNKHEKGPSSTSHVKSLDKVLTNVTTTTPVYKETVEGMKDGELNQNTRGNSSPELFIRSISTLVETETNSNDTPLDRRCNLENEFSLELSVNKIAEEIYRLVRPHKHVGNLNRSIVSNSCNILTKPTKVTEEKIIKKENSQKYIAEGTRMTKMIDPIAISSKKRNKHHKRMNSHFQSKASEIIDITDEMSPKSPSRKSEKTMISTEANIVIKTPKNNNRKAKEISSKHKPSTFIAKPKIVLSTKKPNKLTETIFKIKAMQQKESSLSAPTKSQKQSSNTTPPSSTMSKSISEKKSLPKQIDTGDVIIPNDKNVGTPKTLLNENDESKNIRTSSPKISKGQLPYSNQNYFKSAPNEDNHPPNAKKNKVSTDSNVTVKTSEKEEKRSDNNYSENVHIISKSSKTVNRDESNNSSNNKSSIIQCNTEKIKVEYKFIETKEKLKHYDGTHQFPTVNPKETANNNFAIPTIVSNRETIIPCTNFDTVPNNNSNVSNINPAVILNTSTAQNNQLPAMAEPLTVYNSMQAHALYKPPVSSYQSFRQSLCNAVRFPSHIPQINQPISNYTGHPLVNTTLQPREILPHIETRPASSSFNEKILPQTIHRLPMAPLQPKKFGAPMLNGIRPNMPSRMRDPGQNVGFEAQISSNPFGVSSQISRPQVTVPPQMPMDYRQIPIGEMQSYDVLWSGPFSCMPPPPPPPPPSSQPALQDISASLPKILLQSMDSSIIGRNINGIVKKINITAPVIEQNEEIASKTGIIKIENLEKDASTPLYDEIPSESFENIEPINTKKEMLRLLDNGLQRVYSRFDDLTPANEIQNHGIKHSTINCKPNSQKLMSQGKLGKSPNATIHEKCNSGTQIINGAVKNSIKIDRAPSKEHQKNDKPLPQKKEIPHKSNHYLNNFIRKPKEKKAKKKEIPPKKYNKSVTNRAENVAEQTAHEDGVIKISANHSSCIPKQIKFYEKTKPLISNHLKYNIQDSKERDNLKKKSDKGSKKTFEDLFGDEVDDDVGFEKVVNDNKSTGKRHSGLVNTEQTSEKSYESSRNLKRPANNEMPALLPKYRPGPLSKKKKLDDQEKVNPHQMNKKQILQSKTYSDPILPIPTYEKILSNMPSYLCFRDDMKISSVTNSKYKKTSGSINHTIPDTPNKSIEKEKKEKEKLENIKKISLYEYKKRSTSERKVDHEAKDNCKKKHVEMHRRPSHADSDLGYDSDNTVKL